MKRAVETQHAPAAIGPYSHAIDSGDWVFCSGQLGTDPDSGSLVKGGIEAETQRALENLKAVLAGAGLGLENVVKTTVFLVDLGDYKAFNRVYQQYMSPPYPARATVQVAALLLKGRIEIEAVARRPRAGQ